MFSYLEIDYQSNPIGNKIAISFMQVLNGWNGCPVAINRFTLPVKWSQVLEAQNDPNSLRIYVEYDQRLFYETGHCRIVSVGFCTASYRPSIDETLQIYSLPELIHSDAEMKGLYDAI